MISEIQLSTEEHQRKSLSPENLSLAIAAINTEGYLIVRGVLPDDRLERLRDLLDEEWKHFLTAKPAWRGGGKIIGHLGLMPPKTADFIDPEILCHPIIQSIVSGVLGDGVRITGIGGNVNLPNSVDQQFHSDLEYPQSDKLMVNIPLGDVNEQNGSLDLIPRTHISEQSDQGQSLRANTRNGDVIIRFLHLQHRGKRNLSNRPRYMLGFWQSVLSPERQKDEKICLDPGSRDLLDDCLRQFEAVLQGGAQPVFGPNYFAPNAKGLVKEMIYRFSPSGYGYLTRVLGRSSSKRDRSRRH